MRFPLDPVTAQHVRTVLKSDAPDIIQMAREIGVDLSSFFEGEDLSNLDLRRANLRGVSFKGANLQNSLVTKDQFEQVMLSGPRLAPQKPENVQSTNSRRSKRVLDRFIASEAERHDHFKFSTNFTAFRIQGYLKTFPGMIARSEVSNAEQFLSNFQKSDAAAELSQFLNTPKSETCLSMWFFHPTDMPEPRPIFSCSSNTVTKKSRVNAFNIFTPHIFQLAQSLKIQNVTMRLELSQQSRVEFPNLDGCFFAARGFYGEICIFQFLTSTSTAQARRFLSDQKAKKIAELMRDNILPFVAKLGILKPNLTPRETEVLQWIASGKSQEDVAEILNISPRTVEHYIRSCREKLYTLTSAQAVGRAIALNLIYPS